mgnify:CR=1 FL=1
MKHASSHHLYNNYAYEYIRNEKNKKEIESIALDFKKTFGNRLPLNEEDYFKLAEVYIVAQKNTKQQNLKIIRRKLQTTRMLMILAQAQVSKRKVICKTQINKETIQIDFTDFHLTEDFYNRLLISLESDCSYEIKMLPYCCGLIYNEFKESFKEFENFFKAYKLFSNSVSNKQKPTIEMIKILKLIKLLVEEEHKHAIPAQYPVPILARIIYGIIAKENPLKVTIELGVLIYDIIVKIGYLDEDSKTYILSKEKYDLLKRCLNEEKKYIAQLQKP